MTTWVFCRVEAGVNQVLQPELSEDPMPASILLVEDDVLVRLTAADFLRELGYLVIEAGTAAEAWDYLIAAHPVSLVFSDVRMPGAFDGLELARRIRDRFPAVAVFITSGHLDRDEVEPSISLITKPYDLNQVATRIEAALRAVKGRAAEDQAG